MQVSREDTRRGPSPTTTRLPSLSTLCATRMARDILAHRGADDAASQMGQTLPEHLQSAVVEALCARLHHAPDAQDALRLGRMVPALRAVFWDCIEPRHALGQTALYALLREPEALAHWLYALQDSLEKLSPMTVLDVLHERLTLFATLCAQGGFDPEEVGDLGSLQSCLTHVLASMPPDLLFEPRARQWYAPPDDDDVFLAPWRPPVHRPRVRIDPVLPPPPTAPWLPFHRF